jgi:hypothetical protein
MRWAAHWEEGLSHLNAREKAAIKLTMAIRGSNREHRDNRCSGGIIATYRPALSARCLLKAPRPFQRVSATINDMKGQTEMIEGPDRFDGFQRTMRATPDAEIQRWMEEQRKQLAANPNWGEPKPQARRADMKDESRGALLRDKYKNFGDDGKHKPPKDSRNGGSQRLKKKD